METTRYNNTTLPDNEYYRNRFVRTPGFNNYLDRGIDEPVYLGFKILFHFSDPMSPLLNLSNNKGDNTALNYLQKNGYKKQYEYLKSFIDMLQYVSQRSEWYFQKIEGLDQIIGWDFVENKIKEDKQFTIHTLEALDLRINSLLDNYYRACFDQNSRTVVIPKNLRYFAMSIYITDLREFASDYYNNNDMKVGEFDHGLEDSASRPSLFYRFDLCEFDKNTKGNMLQTIDNNQNQPNENKIIINQLGEVFEYPLYILDDYLDAADSSSSPQNILSNPKTKSIIDKAKSKLGGDYRVIEDSVKDGTGAFNEIKNKFGDKEFRVKNLLKEDYNNTLLNKAKNKINNALEKTLLNGITDIERKLSGAIKPLILGNVYGQDDVNVARRSIKQILDQGVSFF